jgi:hypothetical protein
MSLLMDEQAFAQDFVMNSNTPLSRQKIKMYRMFCGNEFASGVPWGFDLPVTFSLFLFSFFPLSVCLFIHGDGDEQSAGRYWAKDTLFDFRHIGIGLCYVPGGDKPSLAELSEHAPSIGSRFTEILYLFQLGRRRFGTHLHTHMSVHVYHVWMLVWCGIILDCSSLSEDTIVCVPITSQSMDAHVSFGFATFCSWYLIILLPVACIMIIIIVMHVITSMVCLVPFNE